MKYYLAGPWFTEKADILENYAYSMFESTKDYNNCEVFRPREESTPFPNDTFLNNLNAINNSDIVVALISEKDVGTAFEIGYARALGKKIILVGFNMADFKRKTNLMLAFASDYCITIDNLWKLFTNKLDYNNDTIKFSQKWEDIE